MVEAVCEKFLRLLNKVVPGYGSLIKLYIMKNLGRNHNINLCHVLEIIKSICGEDCLLFIIKIVENRDPSLYSLCSNCLRGES